MHLLPHNIDNCVSKTFHLFLENDSSDKNKSNNVCKNNYTSRSMQNEKSYAYSKIKDFNDSCEQMLK